MLFQSSIFLFAFLPACLLGAVTAARFFGNNGAVYFLVAASLLFYGYHEPSYVVLIIFSVAANHFIARLLTRNHSIGLLTAGIAFNLLLLGYYKYANFLTVSLGFASSETSPFRDIVLPIAISFVTFQQIAFLVDTRRGQVSGYGFSKYLLFVVFFPQLIAGPIVHHSDVGRQYDALARKVLAWRQNLGLGAIIFSIGLAKKLLIADHVAPYADTVFDLAAMGHQPDLVESWIGILAYAIQIYFDFSGYSDMAVGLARMFGIVLPINFRSPYQAHSIIDFWRRWHITLSRFLRDYLYLPLGGNRKGRARRYANLIVVMALGGIWHGANWTFLLWGVMHGLYLLANHAWRSVMGRRPAGRWGRLAGWGLTFLSVSFAWIPFRAADMSTTLRLFEGALGLNGIALPNLMAKVLPSHMGLSFDNAAYIRLLELAGYEGLLWLPLGLIIAVLLPNLYETSRASRPALIEGDMFLGRFKRLFAWRPTAAATLAAMALFWISIASQTPTNAFLYFQF